MPSGSLFLTLLLGYERVDAGAGFVPAEGRAKRRVRGLLELAAAVMAQIGIYSMLTDS